MASESPRPKVTFDGYVGIDYSGSGLPTDGKPGIQVFAAAPEANAEAVAPPVGNNWSRAAVAAWLIEQIARDKRLIIGIDHSFALPREKMGECATWLAFLQAFREEWRTDERQVTKDSIATRYPGCQTLLRLTEQWTSSAKSVVTTQVAPS